MISEIFKNKVKDALVIGNKEILQEIPRKINVEYFFDTKFVEDQNFFERFDACILNFEEAELKIDKKKTLFLEIYNSLKPLGILLFFNQDNKDDKELSIYFKRERRVYRKPLSKGIFSFGFLKPDIMNRKKDRETVLGELKNKMEVIKLKEIKITKKIINKLYFESKSSPHFNLLCNALLGKKSLFFIVKEKNAVDKLNNLVGITNPKFAKKGTLRNKYGIDILKNSIHSANINRVNREIFYMFPEEYEKIMKNERKN
ncbi:MAG: hypothetical protein CMN79_03745 [Spirochaetales bacterium]|jgi:nucleoside-diphosphate kinase|nr:hypothetical protein [Spirochaetales bacterium]|tara:strand:- start:3816 stop:4589 length:774 start_codon:yes stop_codon:yes gene_type:complete